MSTSSSQSPGSSGPDGVPELSDQPLSLALPDVSDAELSLDDFGTGTSNIAQLLKLTIHVVKLDMSVVHSYFKGESKLLPDLIQMFRNSNMKIVVEGVETVDMKTQLAEMGCDYEQGFFFSKPVPPQIFLDYLKTA